MLNVSGGRWPVGQRRRWYLLVTAATAAVLLFAAGFGPTVPRAEAAGCKYPAQILDLTNWKLQLPLPGNPDSIVEIKQPQLAQYAKSPYFIVANTKNCGAGVRFRAPINGAHTSGSHYARSELREMTPDGMSNASWSSTVGTHTFDETVAFIATPTGKPDVVGAQIHNATEDISLLVLRGTNLYVTNSGAGTFALVSNSYKLGTNINMRWTVSGGTTQAFVNGVLQLSFDRAYAGAYFKAGAYPQASCQNASPCKSSNYGSTIITKLMVSHTPGTVVASKAGLVADMTERAPVLAIPPV